MIKNSVEIAAWHLTVLGKGLAINSLFHELKGIGLEGLEAPRDPGL